MIPSFDCSNNLDPDQVVIQIRLTFADKESYRDEL